MAFSHEEGKLSFVGFQKSFTCTHKFCFIIVIVILANLKNYLIFVLNFKFKTATYINYRKPQAQQLVIKIIFICSDSRMNLVFKYQMRIIVSTIRIGKKSRRPHLYFSLHLIPKHRFYVVNY